MSWKAQAWAVDQRVGSPVKKLVLIMLAEAAHKETHRSWVSVERLATECECDDRSVRKALKDLQESGHIADTGSRVGRQKNVTVWSFPLFEASLVVNPDKNVGVHGLEGGSRAQATDLTSVNGAQSTGNPQPLQKCQGSDDRTPTLLRSNPDKNASGTLPKMGGESSDPNLLRNPKSAGARAIPSGSRAAGDDAKPYDHAARSDHWRRMAAAWVVGECNGLGITTLARQWADLPTEVRLVMPGKVEAAVAKAISRETESLPLAEAIIRAELQQFLTEELRQFKPVTPADRAAAHAHAA